VEVIRLECLERLCSRQQASRCREKVDLALLALVRAHAVAQWLSTVLHDGRSGLRNPIRLMTFPNLPNTSRSVISL
jgi:hypothetical protein